MNINSLIEKQLKDAIKSMITASNQTDSKSATTNFLSVMFDFLLPDTKIYIPIKHMPGSGHDDAFTTAIFGKDNAIELRMITFEDEDNEEVNALCCPIYTSEKEIKHSFEDMQVISIPFSQYFTYCMAQEADFICINSDTDNITCPMAVFCILMLYVAKTNKQALELIAKNEPNVKFPLKEDENMRDCIMKLKNQNFEEMLKELDDYINSEILFADGTSQETEEKEEEPIQILTQADVEPIIGDIFDNTLF